MGMSNKWTVNIRLVAKTLAAFILAVIIVGMSMTPSLARDDRGRHGHRGYYGHREYHGHRWHHEHRGYYWNGSYWDYYYYPPPVYAPPPPVYAPPGINFVFPIHVR